MILFFRTQGKWGTGSSLDCEQRNGAILTSYFCGGNLSSLANWHHLRGCCFNPAKQGRAFRGKRPPSSPLLKLRSVEKDHREAEKVRVFMRFKTIFQENLRFSKDQFIRNAGFWLGNQVCLCLLFGLGSLSACHHWPLDGTVAYWQAVLHFSPSIIMRSCVQHSWH